MSVATEPVTCVVCGATFAPARPGHECCSSTCRQRKHRGTHLVTAEDRAAIARARALVPIPIPLPTPAQVEAIVAAHLSRRLELPDADVDTDPEQP